MPAFEPRMLVLVVEDQTLVRMFMADFLDEAGFKVFEAVGADEALTVLEARPDVQAVVTDIEMPGSMNGIELTHVIRDRWPGIGVVVTSGRQRPEPMTCQTRWCSSRSPTCRTRSSRSFGRWPPHRWW